MSNAVIRRENLLRLFSEFVAQHQAQNPAAPVTGLDKAFAQQIQVHNTYLSGMKSGGRTIGDKMARQVEGACGKRKGWLDEEQGSPKMTKDMKRFLALAERAYTQSGVETRKELVANLQHALKII